MNDGAALLALLATPDLASKRWAWQQYDHLIGGNTIVGPGGADAAVVRVEDGPKGLALTADVTPRYCAADPVEGGKQAVAEAWRNLTAVGARPLALTDNLNFGNPEKPEAMGELVGCIRGIGEAAAALDFPIVSGNVSLYNETAGRGILPTPTIGGVGLVDDVAKDRDLVVQGIPVKRCCSSARPEGLARAVALPPRSLRPRRGRCPRRSTSRPSGPAAISSACSSASGRVTAVHDLSDGGLAVGLAEMAMGGGIGAHARHRGARQGCRSHAGLYGEDQGRYLVTCAARARSSAILAAAGDVPVDRVGTTGGAALRLPGATPISIDGDAGRPRRVDAALHGRRAEPKRPRQRE